MNRGLSLGPAVVLGAVLMGMSGLVQAQEPAPQEAASQESGQTVSPSVQGNTGTTPQATEVPLPTSASTELQSQPVAPVVAGPPAEAAVESASPAEPAPAPVAQPLRPVRPVPAPAHPLQLETAGKWSGDFSAGLNLSAGNTDSLSYNLTTDAVYERPDDKLSLFANYLETRSRTESNGTVSSSLTARQWRLGGRYDRNINPKEFSFFGEEFSSDYAQSLAFRSVMSSGVGRHVHKDSEVSWDVYGGLSYREDYYSGDGVVIDDNTVQRQTILETLLGEESTHTVNDTTRFKQKLVFYPGRLQGQGTRATLDAGLTVGLSKTLSLSMKLQSRYDSHAPNGSKAFDLLFFTGVAYKFGG